MVFYINLRQDVTRRRASRDRQTQERPAPEPGDRNDPRPCGGCSDAAPRIAELDGHPPPPKRKVCTTAHTMRGEARRHAHLTRSDSVFSMYLYTYMHTYIHRPTYIETERLRDRQMDRERDIERQREICVHTNRQTNQATELWEIRKHRSKIHCQWEQNNKMVLLKDDKFDELVYIFHNTCASAFIFNIKSYVFMSA